jgi:hypothetical protein
LAIVHKKSDCLLDSFFFPLSLSLSLYVSLLLCSLFLCTFDSLPFSPCFLFICPFRYLFCPFIFMYVCLFLFSVLCFYFISIIPVLFQVSLSVTFFLLLLILFLFFFSLNFSHSFFQCTDYIDGRKPALNILRVTASFKISSSSRRFAVAATFIPGLVAWDQVATYVIEKRNLVQYVRKLQGL